MVCPVSHTLHSIHVKCPGILLTTFVPCIRSLLCSASQKFHLKPRDEIKLPIVAATVVLFLVSSFSAVLALQDVIDAFIDYQGPGGALEFYNTVNGGWKHWMPAVEDTIQVIIGDALIVCTCTRELLPHLIDDPDISMLCDVREELACNRRAGSQLGSNDW
jgi:hypothetical protein